jgi:predicted amidohydrolase YtcJ
VLKLRGPRTRAIDLQGKTVLPGLIDSHVHVMSGGLSELRKPLPPLDSFAAVQDFIRKQAAVTPKGRWIVVPRTFPTRLKEMRMPTREVLDVAPEHPVMFDASYLWVANTVALRVSGITRDTPNPAGGEIVKDAAGEPNGILRNAGQLLKGLKSEGEFSAAEREAALEKMLRLYLAAGLTTVGDRAVNAEEIALYEKLKLAGRLPARAFLTWRVNAARPLDQIVAEIRAARWRPGSGDDWLRINTFKVTLDGGMTIGTAYQRMNYGAFGRQLYGHTTPNRGQLFIAPDKLLAIMDAAWNQGWQMTAHSQGGGAVDALLDTFEKLNAKKPVGPSRSHLMHASFQSPEALGRMARMGVAADVQAAWLYYDGPALKKVFPAETMRWFFPVKSYLRAGILTIGGTDHMIGHDQDKAVNPFNPFFTMWVAITRRMWDGTVLTPEERITREEALHMYTMAGAKLHFAESSKGSIEAGKLADLVVIDRDYLTCAEDEIRLIRPVMVILDGKVAAGS